MKIPAFSKTYEDTKVLDFPGLDFENGKIYAVIGANGSGKSRTHRRESQGRGSLVGCRLWGRTELDTTEAT